MGKFGRVVRKIKILTTKTKRQFFRIVTKCSFL